MAVPFSFLVVEVEAPEDDERVARRHVILGPEGFDLLVVVTRGVWAFLGFDSSIGARRASLPG
jgi:hypothetical protein